MQTEPELWAVVLAGGSGKRLEPLTTALYGEPIPKQFAVIAGEKTLLGQTLERTLRVVPSERVVVVATETHAALARGELQGFPDLKLVLQPTNLDTGIGILVGLVHVLARAPDARVLVVPSDHYVRHEAEFVEALQDTASWYAAPGVSLALLGIRPNGPELEYGWIVPGEPVGPGQNADALSLSRVERFVEKPCQDVAQELLARGALWNTLVFSGLASVCWQLCARQLPGETALFEDYAAAIGGPREESTLLELFPRLHTTNFSRQVLARSVPELGVVESDHLGWSDVGTPTRVFEALRGTPEELLLQRRLDARGARNMFY